MRLWQATRKLRMSGRNDGEEVLCEENPVREKHRRGSEATLPVFLSQDEKGASIGDGDNLFFRSRKVRLERSDACEAVHVAEKGLSVRKRVYTVIM